MNWRDWLDRWGMTKLKISAGFAEMEFSPSNQDRHAAWQLYVELLTRIATQPLDPRHGDEKTALESIRSLFPLTRQILKDSGPDCLAFARLSIVVLNQIIRPFTAEWHGRLLAGDLDRPEGQQDFRDALELLQADLRRYTQMLAEMAGVEEDLLALASF
jgi:hypothetical protein